MATQWYYSSPDGKEQGPFTSSQVRKDAKEGRITPETPVRRSDDDTFVRARCIRNLFPPASTSLPPSSDVKVASAPPSPPKVSEKTGNEFDFSDGVITVEHGALPSKGTQRLELLNHPAEGDWDPIGSDPRILEDHPSEKLLIQTDKPLFQDDVSSVVELPPPPPPIFGPSIVSPSLSPEVFRPTTRRIKRPLDPVFTDPHPFSSLQLFGHEIFGSEFVPVFVQLVKTWLISIVIAIILFVILLFGTHTKGGMTSWWVCVGAFYLILIPSLILRRPMAICQSICEQTPLEGLTPWSVWQTGKAIFVLYLVFLPLAALGLFAGWGLPFLITTLQIFLLFLAPLWLLSFASSGGKFNLIGFVSYRKTILAFFPIACIYELILIICMGLLFLGDLLSKVILESCGSNPFMNLGINILLTLWFALCFTGPLLYMTMAMGKLHLEHTSLNKPPINQNHRIIQIVCGVVLLAQIVVASWVSTGIFRQRAKERHARTYPDGTSQQISADETEQESSLVTPRLPLLEKDSWRLLSGEKQHQESPDTFYIPSEKARNNIKRGQSVNLIFEIQYRTKNGEIECQVERMWVIMTRRVGSCYIGILQNQPVSTEDDPNAYLDLGVEVPFLPEHIIGIVDPPAYVVEQVLQEKPERTWPPK